VLSVRVGAKRVASFTVPLRPVKGTAQYSVPWVVPTNLPRAGVQLCVQGIDAAGNKSPTNCAPLRLT
jgi:hypothetical protein